MLSVLLLLLLVFIGGISDVVAVVVLVVSLSLKIRHHTSSRYRNERVGESWRLSLSN